MRTHDKVSRRVKIEDKTERCPGCNALFMTGGSLKDHILFCEKLVAKRHSNRVHKEVPKEVPWWAFKGLLNSSNSFSFCAYFGVWYQVKGQQFTRVGRALKRPATRPRGTRPTPIIIFWRAACPAGYTIRLLLVGRARAILTRSGQPARLT